MTPRDYLVNQKVDKFVAPQKNLQQAASDEVVSSKFLRFGQAVVAIAGSKCLANSAFLAPICASVPSAISEKPKFVCCNLRPIFTIFAGLTLSPLWMARQPLYQNPFFNF